MKADPPVRRDGRCAQCGGVRKQPPRPQKGIDPAIYELDAFCSTDCARAYHGNPRPGFFGMYADEQRGRKVAA